MRSKSPALRLVGILACIVGVVGYTVFGWQFDSTGGPFLTVIAAACVVLAVGATVWRSLNGQ